MEGNAITVSGPKGEVRRVFQGGSIKLSVTPTSVHLTSAKNRKREKKTAGTITAHVKNMIKGASEGHRYVLKICSGHFPMNVTATQTTFTIKNFLGEKVPRTLTIKPGAKVTVDGQNVVVESTSKDVAGQVAADIEQLTRITNRDPRVFQDGIYITNKDGKEIK